MIIELRYRIAPTGKYKHMIREISLIASPEDIVLDYKCCEIGFQKPQDKFEYSSNEAANELKYTALPYILESKAAIAAKAAKEAKAAN